MALQKCVDGVMVDMSPEEEEEFLATLPQAPQVLSEDPVEKLRVFLDANPDVRELVNNPVA